MESQQRQPWNKGKLVGQKAPLKLRDIWAIRIRLQLRHRTRDLALFNLAIDSKLRACDLVKLRVLDVAHGNQVASRAVVMQQKTQRPVQFEITDLTRQSVHEWVEAAHLRPDAFLFPSRVHASPHLSTREYARIVHRWVAEIGLDGAAYGTHSMRRTNPEKQDRSAGDDDSTSLDQGNRAVKQSNITDVLRDGGVSWLEEGQQDRHEHRGQRYEQCLFQK